MTSQTIKLPGCRSDSLLGYLKSLGILKLVAGTLDPRVKASWDGNQFCLHASIQEHELIDFLTIAYAPSPAATPWKNGSGYDGEIKTAANNIANIIATSGERLKEFRLVLNFLNSRYVRSGACAKLMAADDKYELVRKIRAHCPESYLPWLDAALVLGTKQKSDNPVGKICFPFLLGTGGNDGNLDFSVNYMARVLDICGDVPNSDSKNLVHDALFDTSRGRLSADAAIGQFSPRHAGGANATSGFTADSLVNPWDYILMIEGALLFTGSLGRRTDTTGGRPVFPFAVQSVAGGYGTASDAEESHGEMWLPVWTGNASLAATTDLLRKGRLDLPSDGGRNAVRGVARASEAATAALTRGLPLGVTHFERISFFKRNGESFVATSIGRLQVGERYDSGIAILAKLVLPWVEKMRYKAAGSTMRDALHHIDRELFSYASVHVASRAVALQNILIAVNELDSAVARRSDHKEFEQCPRVEYRITASLDDASAIHRFAAAIASYGARSEATNTVEELRIAGNDAVKTFRELMERRLRQDDKKPEEGWLDAVEQLTTSDAIAFLALNDGGRKRVNRLLKAYRLIRFADYGQRIPFLSEHSNLDDQQPGELALPAAWSIIKLVFDSRSARDERIFRLLFSRDERSVEKALTIAVRRLRALPGLSSRIRDISGVKLDDPEWIACAAALPLRRDRTTYEALLRVAVSGYIQDMPSVLHAYKESTLAPS